MSILTKFSAKAVEKKETIDSFQFIIKKKQTGGYRKKGPRNLVKISKNTISIQPEVVEEFKIGKNWYGALVLDDQKLALILRDKIDPNLYAIQGGGDKMKRQSRHINIPKVSKEFVLGFVGNYTVGGQRSVDAKYLILELLKHKD